MATFDPDSASFRAIPRPIPREPPVTSAYFPLSVIKHLLAQTLWRILGRGKVCVNPRGRDASITEINADAGPGVESSTLLGRERVGCADHHLWRLSLAGEARGVSKRLLPGVWRSAACSADADV